MKELIEIQNELKAPKNLYNSFGKYAYRNTEGVLNAVKPLLKKHKALLKLSDEMIQLGERYYIKATAFFTNESGQLETAIGYAREEENKKGMDGSQITGASSSYARKRALDGLFLIDDTKDSDDTNMGDSEVKEKKPEAKPKAVAYDHDKVSAEVRALKTKADIVKHWNGHPEWKTNEQYSNLISECGKRFS